MNESQNSNQDGSFEIHLAKRQLVLEVRPDQSILNVLQEAGVEVPYSCSEGVCGTCLTKVIEGSPDHWDMYLTPEEQASKGRLHDGLHLPKPFRPTGAGPLMASGPRPYFFLQ